MVNGMLLMLKTSIVWTHIANGGLETPCVGSMEVSQAAPGNRWTRSK
jgi:hypothetical protein